MGIFWLPLAPFPLIGQLGKGRRKSVPQTNLVMLRVTTLPPLPLEPGHNLPPISEEGEARWELLISSQIWEVSKLSLKA